MATLTARWPRTVTATGYFFIWTFSVGNVHAMLRRAATAYNIDWAINHWRSITRKPAPGAGLRVYPQFRSGIQAFRPMRANMMRCASNISNEDLVYSLLDRKLAGISLRSKTASTAGSLSA